MQHFLAAAFENTLRSLGKTGFADWLVESFCQELIGPKPGHFHNDEEEFFGKIFNATFFELTPEAQEIAIEGIISAASNFEARHQCYENVLNMCQLAVLVEDKLTTKLFKAVVDARLPLENATLLKPGAALPETEIEAFALQETFQLVAELSDSTKSSDDYRGLATHILQLLLHNTDETSLTPCWGAMACLAVSANPSIATLEDKARLQTILLMGVLTPRQQFQSMYTHKYRGLLYPYDYSSISKWMMNPDANLVSADIEAPPIYTGNPFERGDTKRETGERAEAVADDLLKELEAA